LTGEWKYDDTAGLPSREEADQYLRDAEGEDYEEDVRLCYEALFAMERPRLIRFEQDPETGQVSMIDPGQAEMLASRGEESEYGTLLIPRGTGVYMLGSTWTGELSGFYPESSRLLEFELDETAHAVSFTYRNWRDEIGGVGVRRPARP